jgi:hypothetical protein
MGAPREEHQEDPVSSTTIDARKDEPRKRRPPLTLKQAALSVKLGQKVTAIVSLGHHIERVTGYLAGADAECWFILQPGDAEVRQLLVSRRDTRVLEIHTDRTYDQEPLRSEMDQVVIPFRTWIDWNVLDGRS